MMQKYAGHWYPDLPDRGSAFRHMEIDSLGTIDSVVVSAFEEALGTYEDLQNMLRHKIPGGMKLWVDPGEVIVKAVRKTQSSGDYHNLTLYSESEDKPSRNHSFKHSPSRKNYSPPRNQYHSLGNAPPYLGTAGQTPIVAS